MCGFGLCSGFRGHLPGGYILSSSIQIDSFLLKSYKRNNPKNHTKNVVVSGRLEQSQKKESEEKKSVSGSFIWIKPNIHNWRSKRRHLKRSTVFEPLVSGKSERKSCSGDSESTRIEKKRRPLRQKRKKRKRRNETKAEAISPSSLSLDGELNGWKMLTARRRMNIISSLCVEEWFLSFPFASNFVWAAYLANGRRAIVRFKTQIQKEILLSDYNICTSARAILWIEPQQVHVLTSLLFPLE